MSEPDLRMCAVCFATLNPRLDLGSGLVTYGHPERIGVEDWGHDPVPVVADERHEAICDFCCLPGHLVTFRTRKGVMMHVPGDEVVLRDYGHDWSACPSCAHHIRNRSKHLLIDRATSVLPALHGDAGAQLTRPEKRARRRMIKDLYLKFFEAQPEEVDR